ncbi:MAG: alpha/beta hydrolase [Anaerolineae bacterium]|nr:alpha/beta hydrolase [Anaerolineae bacterium]
MYCKVECVRHSDERAPVVFLHGFPDSPLMFRAYYSEQEQAQPWLQGRSIYTVAFPNRFTNPNYPPLGVLMRGTLQQEISQILQERIDASPTGKIVLIAHDWGATCSWHFIHHHGSDGIEKMVSLSVGSSFRFDVAEHGLRALVWTYSVLFGSPYFIPIRAYQRLVAHIIVKYGGYCSDNLETFHRDCYHYWYGLMRLLAIPTDLLGLRYQPGFTAFTFPVMYVRAPFDRIATTAAFEQAVQSRPDCRYRVYEDANHWFPEQHAARVLAEIRTFI